MNFISDSFAVSLYPLATFIHKRSASSYLMARIPAPNPTLAKYRNRGFRYIRPGSAQYDRLFEPYKCRRVGDKHCWTVKLNSNAGNEDFYYPILANTWRLVDNTGRGGFWMDCGLLRSAFLEERYCVSSSLLSSLCSNSTMWYARGPSFIQHKSDSHTTGRMSSCTTLSQHSFDVIGDLIGGPYHINGIFCLPAVFFVLLRI